MFPCHLKTPQVYLVTHWQPPETSALRHRPRFETSSHMFASVSSLICGSSAVQHHPLPPPPPSFLLSQNRATASLSGLFLSVITARTSEARHLWNQTVVQRPYSGDVSMSSSCNTEHVRAAFCIQRQNGRSNARGEVSVWQLLLNIP